MKNEEITLELSREHYPQVLSRYGPEGARKVAIDMCLKQYPGEMTKGNLMSCLSNLESDLERMFPSPRTPEEEDEEDADEEERWYQEEIAEMKPYLVDGKQLMVDEDGDEPGIIATYKSCEGPFYPVWETKDGSLKAYTGYEEWIYLDRNDWEPEEEDED